MGGHRRTRLTCVAVSLALSGAGLLFVAAEPAGAVDVFTVNTPDDHADGTCDGTDCSLRDAFEAAEASVDDSEIVLATSAVYDLDRCGRGDLDHATDPNLTLTGNGATIRQTCPGERVMEYTGDGEFIVTDVTITGGTPDQSGGSSGGGISVDHGFLTVANSVITGNQASPAGGSGGGIDMLSGELLSIVDSTITDNGSGDTGGGIRSFGDVAITRSTIAGNVAADDGGGIDLSQGTSLLVVNSTITGNEAGGQGGGIATSDPTELTSVTVVENKGNGGANIRNYTGNTLEMENSVIAAGKGSPDCGGGGSVVSVGHNADGDGSCGLTDPGDQSAIGDPLLGPLAPSGTALVRVPLAGSALLDAVPIADCGILTPTDQRGVTKPVGSFCDIGAVEAEAADLQADGLAKRASQADFVGLGVINDTGKNQKVTAKRAPQQTAHFVVQARNDAPLTDDTLGVLGSPGTNRFFVRYERSGVDVTADVTSGALTTASLNPEAGEDIDVFVRVRAGTPSGRTLSLLVTTSDSAATGSDTVKLKTKAL